MFPPGQHFHLRTLTVQRSILTGAKTLLELTDSLSQRYDSYSRSWNTEMPGVGSDFRFKRSRQHVSGSGRKKSAAFPRVCGKRRRETVSGNCRQRSTYHYPISFNLIECVQRFRAPNSKLRKPFLPSLVSFRGVYSYFDCQTFRLPRLGCPGLERQRAPV